MVERTDAYRGSVGRSLEDLGTDCDNIKIDLKHVGRGGIERINLDEDRYRWRTLLNAIMKLRIT